MCLRKAPSDKLESVPNLLTCPGSDPQQRSFQYPLHGLAIPDILAGRSPSRYPLVYIQATIYTLYRCMEREITPSLHLPGLGEDKACGERHPKTEAARRARGNHPAATQQGMGISLREPCGKRQTAPCRRDDRAPSSLPNLPEPPSSFYSLLPTALSASHLSAPSPLSFFQIPSQISPSPLVPSLSEPLSLGTLPSPFSFLLSTLVLASPPPLPAVNLGMDRAIVLRALGPRRRRGRCERGHSGAFVRVPAAVNALLVHSCTKMAGTAAPTQASPFGGVQGACPGGHIALFVWSPAEAEDNAFISPSGPRVSEGWWGRTTGPEKTTSSGISRAEDRQGGTAARGRLRDPRTSVPQPRRKTGMGKGFSAQPPDSSCRGSFVLVGLPDPRQSSTTLPAPPAVPRAGLRHTGRTATPLPQALVGCS